MFTTKGGKNQEYWKFAEICIVGNFSISPSNAEISNDAVSNLFEFHSIDDVLKGAAVRSPALPQAIDWMLPQSKPPGRRLAFARGFG